MLATTGPLRGVHETGADVYRHDDVPIGAAETLASVVDRLERYPQQ